MFRRVDINNLYVWLILLFFFTSAYANMFPLIKSYSFIVFLFMMIFYYKIRLMPKSFIITSLLISFIFSFQMLYITLGQMNGARIGDAVTASKYLLVVLLLPILVKIFEKKHIYRLVNLLSNMIVIKIILIAILAILINSTSIVNISMIYEFSNLTPYFTGFIIRVFDNFSPFFPISLFFIRKSSLFNKMIFHLFLFMYIFYGGSLGLYISYLIILVILFRNYWKYILIVCILFLVVFFNDIYELVMAIYNTKITSIGIKNLQFDWIINNLTLFGYGIGYIFDIDGRDGFIIENMYIYWLGVYGIIGTLIYLMLFVFYPLYILYKYRNDDIIYYIGLTYISILIASGSNPYALSGVTILFPLILISKHIFDINKLDLIKRNNSIILEKNKVENV